MVQMLLRFVLILLSVLWSFCGCRSIIPLLFVLKKNYPAASYPFQFRVMAVVVALPPAVPVALPAAAASVLVALSTVAAALSSAAAALSEEAAAAAATFPTVPFCSLVF